MPPCSQTVAHRGHRFRLTVIAVMADRPRLAGNEGARQRGRFNLPAMTGDYIDACCREAARVLKPSGYLLRWTDTFHLCEGDHLRISELKCVDLIAWDSLRLGNGYRSRRRGDYLLVMQKAPLV